MFEVEKITNFMLTLQSFIYREHTNLIMSPFSLELIFYNLLYGITGPSFEELVSKVFHENMDIDSMIEAVRSLDVVIDAIKSEQNVSFRIFNLIYLSEKYTVIPSFVEFVSTNLDTKLKLLNYQDVNLNLHSIIEEDIKKLSDGKANHFAHFMPSGTRFIMVNYISFHGGLKTKPTRRYKGKFFADSGDEIDVEFTIQKSHFNYQENSDIGFTYVQIPYQNKSMSLCLILPNEGVSPRHIMSALDFHVLKTLLRKSSPKELEVHLPIVKIQSSVDLAIALQIKGIQKVFEHHNSGFTNFVTNPEDLYLESIITNSEWNLQSHSKEEITSEYDEDKSTSHKSMIFKKPFIYVINCDLQAHRGIVLLSGVVNKID